MRRISFIIAILGIFILIGLIFWMPYQKIKNINDLNKTIDNEKVILTGFVKNGRIFSGKFIFTINGIKVVCEGCRNLRGKNVQVKGLINEYNGNKKIEVLEVRALS